MCYHKKHAIKIRSKTAQTIPPVLSRQVHNKFDKKAGKDVLRTAFPMTCAVFLPCLLLPVRASSLTSPQTPFLDLACFSTTRGNNADTTLFVCTPKMPVPRTSYNYTRIFLEFSLHSPSSSCGNSQSANSPNILEI